MLSVFTTDARVLEIGSRLLAIAAAFQLFDGTQAVTTGVLRGIGDTRTPMVMNVIGHWVLGLPVGYALCFRFGVGRDRLVDRLVDRPDLLCGRADGHVDRRTHPSPLRCRPTLTRRSRL